MDLVAIPELWREAPRRWGHPLHRVCSYFAMFPPQLPRVIIEWLTQPGDIVYDPFSGRGTVALEAVLSGRTAWAADANPLAVALSRAKVNIPTSAEVAARLRVFKRAYDPRQQDPCSAPDEIRMLYTDGTLKQLLFLRSRLSTSRADAFIRAMTLGMMHANHSSSGATRGFSVSMPNTFAMGPNYVRRYIHEHKLVAPEVDVFGMLHRRLKNLSLPPRPIKAGKAWQADASDRGRPGPQRAKLLLTSPPYLEVIKYAKYNWIRLWFLGADWRSVDQSLTATGSLAKYCDFMGGVLDATGRRLSDDAIVALVIGDVRRDSTDLNLAEKVQQMVAEPRGWRTLGTIVDEIPPGRKVSRIWKSNAGRATKTDRVLLLTRDSKQSLPELPNLDWATAGVQLTMGESA